MPYINNVEELKRISNKIPAAETAKMAIVRPSEHFQIVTGDNPDMIRTLKQQKQFVKKRLPANVDQLPPKEVKSLKAQLKRAFQKQLSENAAIEQKAFLQRMRAEGIPIFELLEEKEFTDGIFATDTGQYFDSNGQLIFIPGSFKNAQRQGEERLATAQAINLGAEIQPLLSKEEEGKKLKFEGGDIRQMPGKKLFFIGQGHRSDAQTSKTISAVSDYYVVPVELLQAQFYHLDCCFLPLPHDSAVIYEGEYKLDEKGEPKLDKNGWPMLIEGTQTMTVTSRELIRAIYPPEKLVLINKAEALAFATNAALLQNPTTGRFKMFVNGNRSDQMKDEAAAIETHQISLTEEHIEKIKLLTQHEMDVIEVPYSTMHGSGGSVRCTVQEVACPTETLTPYKFPSYHCNDANGRLQADREKTFESAEEKLPDVAKKTSKLYKQNPHYFSDCVDEIEKLQMKRTMLKFGLFKSAEDKQTTPATPAKQTAPSRKRMN